MRQTLLALLALPLPALAQGQPAAPTRAFQPPPGCTAFLTVQMASCTVSQHFTCDQDPDGWQRRVDMDEGGITYFGAIDAGTQWVESFHVLSNHAETLGASPDPADLDTLIATGRDSFDFVTESPQIGQTRYSGEDRLTGATEVIDGVTLDVTEYDIVASTPDGKETWRGTGQEYISRDWRMFLSGVSTYTADGDSHEANDKPVEFARPGEKGFLSSTPTHGCGAVMSSLPAPMSVVPEGRG